MTTVASPQNQIYSKCFWSLDSSAQDSLILQNEKSTKTLHSLSTFYKEFISLENEYSRKLSSLVHRMDLAKNENTDLLRSSLDVFYEQCLKISDSHSLQSRRVEDSLQVPLLELISNRKAREKVMEVGVRKLWNELSELKSKCEAKSVKYENIWEEMSLLKRSRMTLDNREMEKLENKLTSMKSKMLILREENWQLVNKYNEKLDDWVTLWWDTCNELQSTEEQKIRFIKTNLWEFANILSLFCVEKDQFAENIRFSLQNLSASKDINQFANDFSVGDELPAPLKFIDFAKNETRPIHEQNSRKFNIVEIPRIRSKIEHERELRQRKKNPPPESTDSGEVAFSYIGKSKETFKELQEEAQREASQMKLNIASNNTKTISEPSTCKLMSDYSTPTTETSISSHSFDNDFEDINFHNNEILKYQKNPKEMNSGQNESINLDNIDSSPLRTAFLGFKNGDNLRESMAPSKDNNTNRNKHNSFAHLVKTAFNESPNRNPVNNISDKFEFKQILPGKSDKNNKHLDDDKNLDITERINRNSLMIAKPKDSVSKSLRKTSNNMRKSKSQMNLKNRHISLSELPSHSSEGYPVINYSRAQYNYTAAIEEELSFRKKDVLLILHKQADGWWFAENINSGDSGLVPSNYLVDI